MTAPKFNPNIENLHDGKVYIKNLYDADAYRLFSMPYGALTDDEKAKAKAQSKVVAYCAQGPLRPTESKPAEPPKIELNLRPDVQAAKDAYLESLTEKQRNEAAKIEAGRNKTALRHKIADLRLKVQRGHYPAGAERAAALKELYSLENQL
jgi:hypothetical protein